MPSIRVNESVKAIVDQCVADGAATTASAFVEAAVRLYADYLADDEEMMIVEAKAGIADIEAGRYVTIATQADRDALLKRVRARAAVLLEKVRAKDADRVPAPRVTAHAAE